MKKFFTLTGLLWVCLSFSQEITLSKGGRKFEKDGIEYRITDYKTQFTNPIAKNYIREGRSYTTVSSVLGFCGGLLIGGGLPNALSKQKYTFNLVNGNFNVVKEPKPGWTLVAVGGAVVAVAIPLAIIGKNKIQKGVKLENQFSTSSQSYYQFDFTGNGMALTYHF
ncbi:hypothetical protein [Chryseobacterium sp.]|uniref:hypothetical protein n=1 Tax=Chryseobacterium sp. TaxID=1871047 RepID=UPI0011CB3026|nr:hypothetical protein [Chryseobacterium sp.]TXF76130.1 hypothetical protein FUA25_09575 [Chryseobacterium sp.]